MKQAPPYLAAKRETAAQAFSMAIVVFELMGHRSLLVPLVAAAVAAVRVAHTGGPSFFDAILLRRGLPGRPHLGDTRGLLPVTAAVLPDLPAAGRCVLFFSRN